MAPLDVHLLTAKIVFPVITVESIVVIFAKLHFNCVHNYNLNANQVINKLFNKKVFIFRTVSRF